jgi:hypothetical protein
LDNKFSNRVREISVELDKSVDKVIKEVASIVGDTVRERTPIDKGVARDNWRTALNSPIKEAEYLHDGESRREWTRQVPISKKVVGDYKKGDIIYITNNVDYMEKLNAGSSRQAPANFIDHAISAGLNIIRNRKLIR